MAEHGTKIFKNVMTVLMDCFEIKFFSEEPSNKINSENSKWPPENLGLECV
jgi:hypothetical protein